jgi:hypothetical protein
MEAILAAAEPYEIHGTRFYRIAWVTADDPDRVSQGRIAREGMYANPQPGDRVEIRVLLGVLDSVTKLEGAEA